MKTFRLLDLPPEMVQRICGYLEEETLLAFSSASKACRDLATTRVFENVYIYVSGRTTIKEEIKQWDAILTSTNSYSHVKTVEIADRSIYRRGPYFRRSKMTKFNRDHLYMDDKELQNFHESYEGQQRARNSHSSMNEDASWLPVIDLLRRLSGLRRILYTCSDALPHCLIQMLHDLQGRCELDMRPLDIRPKGYVDSDAPQRFPLLEAVPYMHKLWLVIKDEPTLHSDIYTAYLRNISLVDRVLQRATNTSYVDLWWEMPDEVTFRGGRPMRKGGTQSALSCTDTEADNFSMPLKELRVIIGKRQVRDCISYCRQRIDFSKLEMLTLSAWVTPNDFSNVSKSVRFVSLRSLSLDIWEWLPRPGADGKYHEHQSGLAAFFTTIPPLARLRVSGGLVHDTVATILDRHGPSLHQLWLEAHQDGHPVELDDGLIEKLCSKCTQLEDLKCPIKRTKSDATEVRIYQMLSTIKNLKYLYIVLNASSLNLDPDVPITAYSRFDRQMFFPCYETTGIPPPPLLYGQIRDIFINSAMDQALATSIFELIAHRPNSSLRSLLLEPARLSPEAGALDTSAGAKGILGTISRSYVFRRDVRDLTRRTVTVRDLTDKSWAFVGPLIFEKCDSDEIFHRIWPMANRNLGFELGKWRTAWSGWPLDLAGAGVLDETQRLKRELGELRYVAEGEVEEEESYARNRKYGPLGPQKRVVYVHSSK